MLVLNRLGIRNGASVASCTYIEKERHTEGPAENTQKADIYGKHVRSF